MINPFIPPKEVYRLPKFSTLSDDDLVNQLLDEAESRHFISSDVDDYNFYGSKFKRRMTGPAAERLIQNGLLPEVYQAVYWWCLVFIPILPKGTYAVVDFKEMLPDCNDHSRAFEVQMDWSQVVSHALIAATILSSVGLVVWFVGTQNTSP